MSQPGTGSQLDQDFLVTHAPCPVLKPNNGLEATTPFYCSLFSVLEKRFSLVIALVGLRGQVSCQNAGLDPQAQECEK